MNTALAIIGLVGLSSILAILGRVVLLNRAFWFYRFRYSEAADVVLTTDSEVLQRGGSGLTGWTEAMGYILECYSATHRGAFENQESALSPATQK
jgi:hypothetical protein